MKLIGIEEHVLTPEVRDRWTAMNLGAADPSAAAALRVPVLLHPRTPDAAVRASYYSGFTPELDAAFAAYGLGWHYDAGIQFVRLVLSGAFDRLQELQVILGHWGELVLFYAELRAHIFSLMPVRISNQFIG